MASITKARCVAFLASLLVVSVASAIPCGTVVSYLSGCLPYVTNQGPLGKCCSGVKSVFRATRTAVDRKGICTCLKSLSGSYSGVNLGKVAALPKQCGVNFPYKISPSTDCNKVH